MDSLVQFPVTGRYREDAEMGYVIEDEEHDALEQCALESFPLYMNLRKRMDFASGIVGGPKRRISWGEIAQWMHRDSARGRKAVTMTVSKARRVVGQMVQVGLLEYRTDREADRLMFFLPLAYSDYSEAQKRERESAYHAEIQAAVAETVNCVSMDRFRVREASTGAFVSALMDASELPLPAHPARPSAGDPSPIPPVAESLNRSGNPAFGAQESSFLPENTRQTFDSPQGGKADSPVNAAGPVNTGTSSPASGETRQDSGMVPDTKADNNNPFTPNLNKNSNNTTKTCAPAREVVDGVEVSGDKPEVTTELPVEVRQVSKHPKVTRAIRQALHPDLPDNPAPDTADGPVGPDFSVKAGLIPEFETLLVDERTGVSVQVSPGIRQKNPAQVLRMQALIASLYAGRNR